MHPGTEVEQYYTIEYRKNIQVCTVCPTSAYIGKMSLWFYCTQ